MKILSLYDGVSCGRVALERAGIAVERYVALENDKWAVEVSHRNYPGIEHRGEITADTDFSEFAGFDMVIGGSPCTYWSIAKQNRETTCEGIGFELFMHFVRAVRQTGCKWFLYENNHSIHRDIKAEITRALGVEHIMINSALISAQSRKRCYWTNIPGVQQPADRGILLSDIIEDGLPINTTKEGKCKTTKSQYGKSAAINALRGGQFGATMIFQRARGKNNGGLKFDKSPTLTANSWQENNHAVIPICVNPKDDAGKQPCQAKRIYNVDGKYVCVTKAYAPYIAEPIRVGHYGKGGQAERIYSVRGKSISIKSTSGGAGSATGLYKIDLPDGDYIIRKLTPIEVERLQTLPDNYTAAVSNAQRYRQCGNGWTVEVIAHILSYIPAAELARNQPLSFRRFNSASQQLTLF